MSLFNIWFGHINARPRRRRKAKRRLAWMESCVETEEDGSALSLTRLCLLSLAANMKNVWAKDYADNYMDQYTFRYIMGPFNYLPGELVEDLTVLLCTRKQMSRAALHLLLVPQCRSLSLESCPALVTSGVCVHISSRCQGLLSLNLSGAHRLRSKCLCEAIQGLPALRSLSLAGVYCDKVVIEAITHCCRFLRHLDVSHCHLLSPTALLPLGVPSSSPSSDSPQASVFQSPDTSSSSSSSSYSSSSSSPLPLTSLLAVELGLSEKQEDSVAAVAYLLLSLPFLERVAIENVGEACCLIEQRQFSQADEFTCREGILSLENVWRDRKLKQDDGSWKKTNKDENDEEEMLWEDYNSENDDSRDSGPSPFQTLAEEKVPSHSGLTLQLKNVQVLTCESIDSLTRLCPRISSLSVSITDDLDMIGGRHQCSLLATGLETWSGQLQSLTVQFLGPLADLLPALQIAGPSLVSLTLEGVKTSNNTPLLDIITACPRLKELLISAEPPVTPLERISQEVFNDRPNQPSLPHLTSLSISFSHDHTQRIPVMSWRSLREALWCLLIGSPLLEKLSLVSVPCLLGSIFEKVLEVWEPRQHQFEICSLPLPLARLRSINLRRTNMTIKALQSLIQWSRRLTFVDVSYCWAISQPQLATLKKSAKVRIVRD